ncbi:MAG TPA: putative sugar O-methyltransferase [Plantibacter sp.]|uniref:putative sugar O-methyltransferase n=1 Tax=Plantibacter sp. TaxID=1871045 RepID=UPI002D0F8161|nr:putative sugar O-methyltransferase [Plantibacter sp.]
MKVLIVIQHGGYFRNLETLVRELDSRDHELVVLHGMPPERETAADPSNAKAEAKRAKKLARNSAKVVLMFRSIDAAQAELPRVSVDYRPEPPEPWQKRLRVGRNVINRSIYFRKDHPAPDRLTDGLDKLLTPMSRKLVSSPAGRALLAQKATLRAWRAVELASRPSKTVLRVLEDVRPDVVLVSPTVWLKKPVEADYIRAAKSLRIPTVGYVSSWDNLTNKGTIHVIPDVFVVWNEAMAQEAMGIHGIPREVLRVTGAPHVDRFYEMRSSRTSAGVRETMGLDADKPCLVYLCSSRTLIASEVALVTDLAEALSDRLEEKAPTVVVRPHPINAAPWKDYTHPGVVVFPKSGDQADTPEGWQEYYDQLSVASCFVGLNTTAFLEAAVVDRPCLTIVTDELRGAQGETGHFRHLLAGGFLEVADNVAQVAERVARILDGVDEKADARHAFTESFLRPCGIEKRATSVLADTIEDIAARGARGSQPEAVTEQVFQGLAATVDQTGLASLDNTKRFVTARGRLGSRRMAPKLSRIREVLRVTRAEERSRAERPPEPERPAKSGKPHPEKLLAPEKRRGLKDEQLSLLELMREDNNSAGEPFAPTEYWREINQSFDELFRDEGIRDVVRQGFNSLFSTPDRASGKYHLYAMHMLYRHVHAKDERGILDRVHAAGGPKLSKTFGEHAVSWDLLISVDTLYALGELEPGVFDQPVVVADLGAGWGRIGHVLKQVNPQAAYVALDLPESLLVAESYLPRLLPEVPVFGYAASRAVDRFKREDLLDGHGLNFLGPQHLERFEDGAIDLFVNVASFQEMTRAQVTGYLTHADRVARNVYIQARWQCPPSLPEATIRGWEEYDIPASWARRYQRNMHFSDIFFEAGFNTSARTSNDLVVSPSQLDPSV